MHQGGNNLTAYHGYSAESVPNPANPPVAVIAPIVRDVIASNQVNPPVAVIATVVNHAIYPQPYTPPNYISSFHPVKSIQQPTLLALVLHSVSGLIQIVKSNGQQFGYSQASGKYKLHAFIDGYSMEQSDGPHAIYYINGRQQLPVVCRNFQLFMKMVQLPKDPAFYLGVGFWLFQGHDFVPFTYINLANTQLTLLRGGRRPCGVGINSLVIPKGGAGCNEIRGWVEVEGQHIPIITIYMQQKPTILAWLLFHKVKCRQIRPKGSYAPTWAAKLSYLPSKPCTPNGLTAPHSSSLQAQPSHTEACGVW